MSDILSVLAPIGVTTAMLVNSTVPETDYAAWSSATTYASGAFCISTVTHRVYQSQAAGNINHDPTNIINQAGPIVYWTDYGPTNRWAMFDGQVNTQTTASLSLSVVLTPGGFSDIYLAGLDADTIEVTVKDAPGGTIIYYLNQSLEESAPADYDEYFFEPFKPRTDLLIRGIDQYNGAQIAVTLTKASGIVKCGVLALGQIKLLGRTQRGAKAKPKTYSYIKTDEFGNTKIVRRKAATDMSASSLIERSEANAVLQTVQSLLDVPAVWICSDLSELAGLRVFGLGSGEVSYDHERNCIFNLTVQGLI